MLTAAQRFALSSRTDLLAAEAALVSERRITWAGRFAEMRDFGRAGGSAMDRRLVIEGMAVIAGDVVNCKFCGPHAPGANGCTGYPNE